MKSLLCLLLVLSVFAVSARAELYKWTDDKGVVNFTDNPETIPPKYLKKIQKRPSITVEIPESAPVQTPETVEAAPNDKAKAAQEEEITYGGHNEQWWRTRYAALREELKSLQDKLPEKKEELVEARRKLTLYTYSRYRTAYYDKLSEIEKDENRIKELSDQLESLDIEASRAGVPTDWRR